MDIFPVAPAPQPEPSIQNSTSPGTDDTGFDTVLNKTISSTENSSETSSDSTRSDSHGRDSVHRDTNPNSHQNLDTGDSEAAGHSTPGSEDLDQLSTAPSQGTQSEPGYNSVYVTTVSLNALLELPQTGSQDQSANLNGKTIEADFKNINLSFNTLDTKVNKGISAQTETMEAVSKGSNEAAARQNSLLLSEIDKLIAQNGDKVTISAQFGNNGGQIREMPGYLNSPLLSQISANGTEISVSTSELPAAVTVGSGSNQLKSDASQPTLRQDAGNQLLNARLAGIETAIDSESAAEKEFQSNSGSGQQASTQHSTSSASTTSLPEHAGGNQIFSTIFSSTQTTAQTESAVSQQLHSLNQQHYFNENEVISQIVNRFSIQTRLQSGRITLQLHPAELGELKIDVEMKGDSLKANIVAHTQQAQELIEKNILRLRTALQEHGMTIEDLLVTFQSDSVEDYSQQQNQFQDHLNSFQNQNGFMASISSELPEDTEIPDTTEQLTAVNMMA